MFISAVQSVLARKFVPKRPRIGTTRVPKVCRATIINNYQQKNKDVIGGWVLGNAMHRFPKRFLKDSVRSPNHSETKIAGERS